MKKKNFHKKKQVVNVILVQENESKSMKRNTWNMWYIVFVKNWILIKYYYRSYKNENSYREYRETSRERSRDRRERERSGERKKTSSLSNNYNYNNYNNYNNNNYNNYNKKLYYCNINYIEQIPVPVYYGVSIYFISQL